MSDGPAIRVYASRERLVPESNRDFAAELNPQQHAAASHGDGPLLIIDGAGTGNWTYADLRRCPSCSSAEAPAGRLSFTLTSVSNGVARGTVTASSDTEDGATGDTVTAKIVPGFEGKGVNLVMTIGSNTERVMCNRTSAGQCGA